MNTTFEKALNLFTKSLSKAGKSTNTIIAYKGDINQLCNFLISTGSANDVTKITTQHIEEFKKSLQDKNYTAKSVSRKINSIKNFFVFLKNEGVTDKDPSVGIKHPKYENGLPRILKPLEYRSLRDACRNDLRATAIVELMLQCGLRIKEIENLKIDNIADNEIVIQAYESHGEHTVPLNNSVKSALKNYLKDSRFQSKNKNVFVTKTGRVLLARNIRSLLNRYFNKADIQNVKVNDLRNTFIAFQLKAGIPIDIVSQIVGHKRISTTEKYLQLIEGKEESRGIKLKEL
ncbi:tyrosine-type recombinase/integrase [Patescibacteria group bacterium]|nr:tyrosine-type recombinase/integrase [Patescibacteria group bacterium]MCG2702585.1 tyrosine-type recombinase/integrase [Candidatus Parcubacteria bacterium]MBU4210627.1 tyrosine-type recombinase/integrase [Patescibacteria group bacterium]MBU4264915.1 tyrosine-type recombinase/integrase [Patescibacteria group bacterium]MBU4390799.1 tyrosine-type recombinase/integrase [Patescibacteria group bacterium]